MHGITGIGAGKRRGMQQAGGFRHCRLRMDSAGICSRVWRNAVLPSDCPRHDRAGTKVRLQRVRQQKGCRH